MCAKMKIKFEKYKATLFEIILNENETDEFLTLINQLKKKGYSKKEIYNLFLDFHSEIQLDERTKNSEKFNDILSDFMDGFTAWGKRFKILPNEPDL